MTRPKATGPFERIPVSYKLPKWLVDWLKEADAPATTLVEQAVYQTYGLTPPVDPAEVERLLQEKQRIAALLGQMGVTDD